MRSLSQSEKRLEITKSLAFLELLASLEITFDGQGSSRAFEYLLPISRAHQLTAYDATHLDLAMRTKLPLATLYEPPRKAAKKAGVALLGK